MKTDEKIVKRKFKTIDVIYIGLFAALITVCSWIQIPLTVPITLQTMGICIAAGLLGARRGTLAVIIYILLGIVGVPVFAGFTSGIGILLNTTGGYIIGFIFTALIVGIMPECIGKRTWVYALSMVLGIAVCYIFGTTWFIIVYNKGNSSPATLGVILGWCVTPFIIPDLIKTAAAALICARLKNYVKA